MESRSLAQRQHVRLAGAAALFTLLTYIMLLGGSELVRIFASHEAIYEHLGAALFLFTSILFFVTLVLSRRRGTCLTVGRKVLYISLGLFFLVAFGEEIAWGFDYLGLPLPEKLEELNVQEQLTIHNLWLFDSYTLEGKRKTGIAALLTGNRLFDYFMITLFILIPLATKLSSIVRVRLENLGFPTMGFWFAFPLLLNFSLTAIFELWRVDGKFLHLAVSETRELNYAFLCFILAWCFFKDAGGAAEPPSPTTHRPPNSSNRPAPGGGPASGVGQERTSATPASAAALDSRGVGK